MVRVGPGRGIQDLKYWWPWFSFLPCLLAIHLYFWPSGWVGLLKVVATDFAAVCLSVPYTKNGKGNLTTRRTTTQYKATLVDPNNNNPSQTKSAGHVQTLKKTKENTIQVISQRS
jgi:hypothetical protein